MDWKSRANVQNKSFDISKNQDEGRRSRTEEDSNQGKRVQCFECEGFGHIKTECPTFLKKQKGLSVLWSDGESDSDLEEESAKLVTALSGLCKTDVSEEGTSCESDKDSYIGELTKQEVISGFSELCIKNEKRG